MAKDLDGTGVTVNVLVPGGVTDTPMISNEAGFDRGKADPAGGYGAAAPLAPLRCSREGDWSEISRRALGPRATARTSGREGWRAGRLDQHCDDANHSETCLGRPGP